MILRIFTIPSVRVFLENKTLFEIVLIQKMKQEFIAMLFTPFYNLLPFLGPPVVDPRESFRDRNGLFFCCTDS
jgi:hypothetical protein